MFTNLDQRACLQDPLADMPAQIAALSALTGDDGQILAEDVVYASCWNQLLLCLTTLLPPGPTGQQGQAQDAGNTSALLAALARLVCTLAKECSATSPTHGAQLLRALKPYLAHPLPQLGCQHLLSWPGVWGQAE